MVYSWEGWFKHSMIYQPGFQEKGWPIHSREIQGEYILCRSHIYTIDQKHITDNDMSLNELEYERWRILGNGVAGGVHEIFRKQKSHY